MPICFAPWPHGAAYVLIVLSDLEQGQRTSENDDCEVIVVGDCPCDGEGQRAYTANGIYAILDSFDCSIKDHESSP